MDPDVLPDQNLRMNKIGSITDMAICDVLQFDMFFLRVNGTKKSIYTHIAEFGNKFIHI